MSGWKRKGFWTNRGWDMIFSHKNLGCCLIGHLHICNFDFRTPILSCMKCRGSWKCWNTSISYNLPFSLWFPDFERVNLGTGREWKKSIPKVREWEGNEKNPFPKFGNGKGMKKIHSRNSGTGREWKKSIPEIREGNQRPPFLGMTGNGKGTKNYND